jgi:opacity protein-like surface antigen
MAERTGAWSLAHFPTGCLEKGRRLSLVAILLAALAFETAGIRQAEAGSPGAGSDTPLRPYLRVALGQAWFADPGAVPNAELESPAGNATGEITFGADMGSRFALELAADYVKTGLNAPGSGRLGDYSLTTMVAQARLRFPRANRALVPYVLGGAGIGYGEFSGRHDFTFSGGGRGLSGLGAAGAGVDYFLVDNVAVSLEAKYQFLFAPRVKVNGQGHDLAADNIAFTGGLRVYFDQGAGGKAALAAPAGPPKDRGGVHPYVAIRLGSGFLTDPDAAAASGLHFNTGTGVMGGGSLGLNLNQHWGTEIAFDYTRAQVTSPAFGNVSGYPVWTILALGRYRYPILDGRLSPYLLAGGGVGFGEAGDADIPSDVTGFRAKPDTSPVATVGGGFDYFFADNLAVGIEAKHSFLFRTKATQNGTPVTLHPDLVQLSAGLRVFFD